MTISQSQAPSYLASHHGPLAEGWEEVDTFETLDPDDYELEEEDEEEYITLDLGPEMDPKYLQTEGTYQLIGMDTGLPHIKIGNTVLQGEITPLIGTEVILGLIRNQENPLRPSHPPLYTTSTRITFRPIHLRQITQSDQIPMDSQSEEPEHGQEREMEMETVRPMFLQQEPRCGPNRPDVFAGRKRDRERAARRAASAKQGAEGMEVDGKEDEEDNGTGGPSSSPIKSLVNSGSVPTPTPYWSTKDTMGTGTPIGRPRTRPLVEINTLPELAHVDIDSLPANVRVMIHPSVIHQLDPLQPSSQPSTQSQSLLETGDRATTEALNVLKTPLEYNKPQLRKLLTGGARGTDKRKIRGSRYSHLAPASPLSQTEEVGDGGEGEGSESVVGTPVGERKKKSSRESSDVFRFVTAGAPPSTPSNGRSGGSGGATASGAAEDVQLEK